MQRPNLNFKWYAVGKKICIEVYTKCTSGDAASVQIAQDHDNRLLLTLDGQQHTFDLYGAVANAAVRVFPTKVEVTAENVSCRTFKYLLKCEEAATTFDKAKAERYAKMEAEADDPKEPRSFTDSLRQVYESGNNDVKRAMMKSFYESGGTVLSTSWDEVGGSRVEPKPPK